MNRRNSCGFTLSEILIVVVILSVLAGMAIPRYIDFAERNVSSEGVNLLTSLLSAERRYALEHSGVYTAILGDLDITVPNFTRFDNPPSVSGANPTIAERATIRRTGLYTLTIGDNGTIGCKDDVDGWCGKLGIGAPLP